MRKYDNTGRGALWENKYWTKDGDAPKWTGKLCADRDIKTGEEIPLSVWLVPEDQRGNNSPVMRIRVDRWKERKRAQESAPAADESFDDDVPW